MTKRKIRKIKPPQDRLVEVGVDPILSLAELAVATRRDREETDSPTIWKDRAALELNCLKELAQYSSAKLKSQEGIKSSAEPFVFRFLSSADEDKKVD